VSDYGLDDWAIKIRSPAGAKDFSSILCVQTGSGTHPASCPMGTGGPFTGGKSRPERDADHSPQIVPRSWMSRSYTPLPQAPPRRVAGLLCFFLLLVELFSYYCCCYYYTLYITPAPIQACVSRVVLRYRYITLSNVIELCYEMHLKVRRVSCLQLKSVPVYVLLSAKHVRLKWS
jgi:hypothetical protein